MRRRDVRLVGEHSNLLPSRMRTLFVVLATLFGLGAGVGVFLLVASQVHMGDYGPDTGGLIALGCGALAVPAGAIAGGVIGVRSTRQS